MKKKKRPKASDRVVLLEKQLFELEGRFAAFSAQAYAHDARLREQAQSEAELRVSGESAAYRKLAVSLLHDRPGIDAFLDRLGDVAPYLQKPPREGQVIELPDVVELISQRLTAYHVERIRQGGGVGEDQIIKAFSDWLVEEFIARKPFAPVEGHA